MKGLKGSAEKVKSPKEAKGSFKINLTQAI